MSRHQAPCPDAMVTDSPDARVTADHHGQRPSGRDQKERS